MAAGGFKFFIPGQVLDEDDINDFLMQGVLVFDDEADRDGSIIAPVHGQVAFLKDSNEIVFYDGTSWEILDTTIDVEYVVVAGGGGGGTTGAGGAGGYRSNVVGENSGGNTSAEPELVLNAGTYQVTIGAGGAGTYTSPSAGSNSIFQNIVSYGGGFGGQVGSGIRARFGGSGGSPGYTNTTLVGLGLARQGFNGGQGTGASSFRGGGGGGAGAVGVNGSSTGNGGAGISSSITGTAVSRAGGGGGGAEFSPGSGTAGGGNGATGSSAGANGAANTGGGGGGGGSSGAANGGNGGSGVVIFRVPTGTSVSFSGGVTHTTETVGDKTAYIVTATSTTSETVTIG